MVNSNFTWFSICHRYWHNWIKTSNWHDSVNRKTFTITAISINCWQVQNLVNRIPNQLDTNSHLFFFFPTFFLSYCHRDFWDIFHAQNDNQFWFVKGKVQNCFNWIPEKIRSMSAAIRNWKVMKNCCLFDHFPQKVLWNGLWWKKQLICTEESERI